jgi:hypothetical protein
MVTLLLHITVNRVLIRVISIENGKKITGFFCLSKLKLKELHHIANIIEVLTLNQ